MGGGGRGDACFIEFWGWTPGTFITGTQETVESLRNIMQLSAGLLQFWEDAILILSSILVGFRLSD